MSRRMLLAVLLLLGSLVIVRPTLLQAARTLPVSATMTVRGVRISLTMPPGPHFLGELVPVTVSLTNTSRGALHYAGGPAPDLCSGGWVSLAGGTAPFYNLPPPRPAPCPYRAPAVLAPRHSATATGLIPLTASGEVHLVASPVVMQVVVKARTTYSWARVLAGPSLLLHVAVAAPATRTLLLIYHNSTVHVRIVRGSLPALLVQTMEQYTTGWGETDTWVPLNGKRLVEPYSPSMGHPTTWTVLVGAPGYRVAVGVYTHAP